MRAYQLPSHLAATVDWSLVGPMGPMAPETFYSRPVVAVDGGADFCTQIDVWVGDKDSFEGEVATPHLFLHPAMKDRSDLALALQLVSSRKPATLHLWGFLGGRKDHELFNLGECLQFLDHQPETQIIFYDSSEKVSFHLVGEGLWRFHHQGPFSLGCVKSTKVRLKGECRYPIATSTALTPLSSFGLSNEAQGEMHLETKGPVFIYYPEGK